MSGKNQRCLRCIGAVGAQRFTDAIGMCIDKAGTLVERSGELCIREKVDVFLPARFALVSGQDHRDRLLALLVRLGRDLGDKWRHKAKGGLHRQVGSARGKFSFQRARLPARKFVEW